MILECEVRYLINEEIGEETYYCDTEEEAMDYIECIKKNLKEDEKIQYLYLTTVKKVI